VRSRDDSTLLGYVTRDSLVRSLGAPKACVPAHRSDRARDVDLAPPDATVVLVREQVRDVEANEDDEAVYAGLVDLTAIVNKVRSAAFASLTCRHRWSSRRGNPSRSSCSSSSPWGASSRRLAALTGSPRVILVEQHGALVGLLTLKDTLRVALTSEFAAEASHGGDDERDLEQALDELRGWLTSFLDRVRGRSPVPSSTLSDR